MFTIIYALSACSLLGLYHALTLDNEAPDHE